MPDVLVDFIQLYRSGSKWIHKQSREQQPKHTRCGILNKSTTLKSHVSSSDLHTLIAGPMSAPEPSAALLALQEKGFELSNLRKNSISPPCTNEELNQNRPLSPCSRISTPSEQGFPSTLNTQVQNPNSSSSPSSAGTTVTKILDLYTNASDWSLESDYEEVTPCSDDINEDHGPAIPTFHQPKAYRDTIATLLEHQFSNYNLSVPPTKSPQSFISMPKLLHPNTESSAANMHLDPDKLILLDSSIGTKSNTSQTSIQITPPFTPPPLIMTNISAPSFQKYSQDLVQRKIALEVPDVRDAGSWYDSPVSPVLPRRDIDNRELHESVTTVKPIDHERQMAYDLLAPPETKKSPNLGSVSVVQDRFALVPSSITIGDVENLKSSSLLRELSTTHPSSGLRVERIAAQQTQKDIENDQELRFLIRNVENKSVKVDPQKHTSSWKAKVGDSSIQGGVDQTDSQARHSGRTFSSESDDSFVIHDTFRGHLKALWGHKFNNQKEKSPPNADDVSKTPARSNHVLNASSQLIDDPESYRYPYKLHDGSSSSRRGQSTPGPTLYGTSNQKVSPWDPKQPSSSRDPRRRSPQRAVPLTRYQKYGPEIWYESKKKKRREEREAAKRAAAAAAVTQVSAQLKPSIMSSSNHSGNGRIEEQQHGNSNIRAASLPTGMTGARDSFNIANSGPKTRTPRASHNYYYNDSIFEASGGKKRSGFANRLLMSSEEKRKLKVKESIMVVGSARMSNGKTRHCR